MENWSEYGQEYQSWAAEQVSLSLERHLSAMMDGERAARSGETSYDLPAAFEPHSPPPPRSGRTSVARSARNSVYSESSRRSSVCNLAAMDSRECPVKRKSKSSRVLRRLTKYFW